MYIPLSHVHTSLTSTFLSLSTLATPSSFPGQAWIIMWQVLGLSRSTHGVWRVLRVCIVWQVDGHYSHDAGNDAAKSAWGNEKRERNSELSAMTKLAHAVMFKALSGTPRGPSSPSLPPMPATNPTGSSWSSWQSSFGTAAYPPSSSASSSSSSYAVAGSMSGGAAPAAPGGTSTSSKAAMSGAAPGLSSYDAQILAGGPPK